MYVPVRRRDTQPQAITDNPDPTGGSSMRPWVFLVIVIGIMLVVGVCVVVVTNYLRRKQYRLAKQQNPTLDRKEFVRRSHMSDVDRMDEDEVQRAILIRKSMNSRSSKRTSQTDITIQVLDDEEEEPVAGLREDWKEWEARIRREQAVAHSRHPSETSKAALPIPAPSRSRSPSRSPPMLAVGAPLLPASPPLGHPLLDRMRATHPTGLSGPAISVRG